MSTDIIPGAINNQRVRGEFQERSIIINESEESRNTPWMDRKQKDDAMFSQGHKIECCAAE